MVEKHILAVLHHTSKHDVQSHIVPYVPQKEIEIKSCSKLSRNIFAKFYRTFPKNNHQSSSWHWKQNTTPTTRPVDVFTQIPWDPVDFMGPVTRQSPVPPGRSGPRVSRSIVEDPYLGELPHGDSVVGWVVHGTLEDHPMGGKWLVIIYA